MSKHLVSFGKPVENKYGDLVRTSTCGKYTITKSAMASARNGHFNAHVYFFAVVATAKRTMCDTLADARMEANYEIDPNWEP